MLRYADHTPFGFPLGCDPRGPEPLDVCSPVFDTIEIVRVNDEG